MVRRVPSRRVTIIAITVAVVIGVVVLGAWFVLDDDPDAAPSDGPDTTATTVALPAAEPDAAAATADYLAADGAAILVVHEQANELLAGLGDVPDSDRCAEAVDTLDAEAPADELVGLIGEVPDEVAGAAFETERVALGRALTACVGAADAEPFTVRLDELASAVAVVDQRLDELEVAE